MENDRVSTVRDSMMCLGKGGEGGIFTVLQSSSPILAPWPNGPIGRPIAPSHEMISTLHSPGPRRREEVELAPAEFRARLLPPALTRSNCFGISGGTSAHHVYPCPSISAYASLLALVILLSRVPKETQKSSDAPFMSTLSSSLSV